MREKYISENPITNSKIRQFCTYCETYDVRSVKQLLDILQTVCSASDAAFIDKICDWSSTNNMSNTISCHNNLENIFKWSHLAQCYCQSDVPQSLKLAMIKLYKVDKVAP